MKLEAFCTIAKAYKDLGWAIQSQIDRVMDGEGSDCNPNALREIAKFFKFAMMHDMDDDECKDVIHKIAHAIHDIETEQANDAL